MPELIECRGNGLAYASKDYNVRKEVSQPSSHSQRSICAGRATGKHGAFVSANRWNRQWDQDGTVHCKFVDRDVAHERSGD